MKKLLISVIILSTYISAFTQTNTWTGATDSDWHKACNWSLNLIPTCVHNVVIPNVANDPIITGIAHCNTIDIQSGSGALLTINSSVSGNLEIGTCPTLATNNGGCFVFPCGGTVIPVIEVVSGGGRIWMDRNLGASQVATSSTDAAAYGDLYQWGRCSDGHEKRTSGTTATLSTTDTPGHGNFITIGVLPGDWRNPQNSLLWQGVMGINNPCPTGYRVPTEVELNAERLSWSTNNTAGAFGSPLKLTVGGFRSITSTFTLVGTRGAYGTSTVSGVNAWYLRYNSSTAFSFAANRANGFSIRCIKN